MTTSATTSAPMGTTKHEAVCNLLHSRRETVCSGCAALDTGRNCWELSISPCCDLTRGSCETCSLYAAAMRRLSRAERARITLSDGTTVEGEVYRRHDERLSDALNNPTRDFIAVRDATIDYSFSTHTPTERQEVVVVAKRAALMVVPLSGPPAPDNSEDAAS